jgi:phosphomannomutase
LLFAELAAVAKRDGVTLQDRLDDIAERFGRHVTAEASVRVDPLAMPSLMAKLRANPPPVLAGEAVTAVQDVTAADLLRYQCGDVARVQIRPSGTEPKVKVYVETVGADPAPFLDAAEQLL